LQQSRHAIPVWIMPLYRIAEQVEMEPGAFDVAIIDEASQTGPDGLILHYLAKQCIVVGDDKQISPEAVGIDQESVGSLIRQHISDLPFSERLRPTCSLFEQTDIRFGNRVTLTEHFRCMPEIIRFSNDLCYQDTPLIPLRQYAPEHLPPIQARFVIDGYRDGSSQDAINRPEAAAVAKTVIDCLGDARYSRKPFGVICLQGRAQAQLIQNMILDKLGAGPFKDPNVRLLCGDPYSFQGDERDVVFLSMVASVEGNHHPGALVRNAFRQRFNVAVSRARDQLWLFHSVREAELHANCMRRRLLQFCYKPGDPLTDLAGKHDSDIERDIASALLGEGFRVIPQYPVAGYWIDLVVEDNIRRLAIECDGDWWHGPDRYDHDMTRQRMLERCGWHFIRVRGSVFYANRAQTIAELIRAIRDYGIAPLGTRVDGATARDWIEEVSGNQCLESLGAPTVDCAEEDVVQQTEGSGLPDDDAGPDERDEPPATPDKPLGPPNPTQPELDQCEAPPTPPEPDLDQSGVERLINAIEGAAPVARERAADAADDKTVALVASFPERIWFEIAHWAKEQNQLEGWQRGLAYSLGVRKRRGEAPTVKQAKQGKIILVEALRLGFSPPDVSGQVG
jgi:very-short-patch-repair endonuclease